jgi:hypothetical protein
MFQALQLKYDCYPGFKSCFRTQPVHYTQRAFAASSRKVVCKTTDTLTKKRDRDSDWWRGYTCQCPGCPAFLKVRGNFIRSDHVGDITLAVVVVESCRHRLKEVIKGFGNVTVKDRANLAANVRRMMDRLDIHPSAFSSYNIMLAQITAGAEVEGMTAVQLVQSGNHSMTGTTARVIRNVLREHRPNFRLDKDLLTSLSAMAQEERGIVRYQQKPFNLTLMTDFTLEVYHSDAGIPRTGIFIDATGSINGCATGSSHPGYL